MKPTTRKQITYQDRIIIDPDIMVGKPVIAGTRIPVDLILEKLATNINVEELLEDYPRLTRADIQAALHYALEVLKGEEVYPAK
ncbi:MAG: DUF433 domain-containing protein [Patescibacteria group bacterium]